MDIHINQYTVWIYLSLLNRVDYEVVVVGEGGYDNVDTVDDDDTVGTIDNDSSIGRSNNTNWDNVWYTSNFFEYILFSWRQPDKCPWVQFDIN